MSFHAPPSFRKTLVVRSATGVASSRPPIFALPLNLDQEGEIYRYVFSPRDQTRRPRRPDRTRPPAAWCAQPRQIHARRGRTGSRGSRRPAWTRASPKARDPPSRRHPARDDSPQPPDRSPPRSSIEPPHLGPPRIATAPSLRNRMRGRRGRRAAFDLESLAVRGRSFRGSLVP